MIMKNILSMTVAAMLALGCVSGHWITLKNGQEVSQSEIDKDNLHCLERAALIYPYAAAISSSGSGTSGQSSTNCSKFGSGVNCTTTGGGYTAPTISTADGNITNRVNYYKTCITALGYKQIFIQDPEIGRDAATSNHERPVIIGCKFGSDSGCGQGESCRSAKGGGTECRKSDGSSTYERPVIVDCTSNSDCVKGQSCRSKSGGGSVCR